MESLKDLLLVEEISKSFGGQKVLDNLSFAVRAGEFLSVLGPSGCGKTTLLRILIGLLPADSGRLLLRGQEITQQPPDKRSMGIVFQNYALFENMTVLRNVEYAMRLRPELRAGARQRALQLLEQVGLAEHVKKYPAQLSGGQMQRVAIARTLALSPAIILFDEPMSRVETHSAGIRRHDDLHHSRPGGGICPLRPNYGDVGGANSSTGHAAAATGRAGGRLCAPLCAR